MKKIWIDSLFNNDIPWNDILYEEWETNVSKRTCGNKRQLVMGKIAIEAIVRKRLETFCRRTDGVVRIVHPRRYNFKNYPSRRCQILEKLEGLKVLLSVFDGVPKIIHVCWQSLKGDCCYQLKLILKAQWIGQYILRGVCGQLYEIYNLKVTMNW